LIDAESSCEQQARLVVGMQFSAAQNRRGPGVPFVFIKSRTEQSFRVKKAQDLLLGSEIVRLATHHHLPNPGIELPIAQAPYSVGQFGSQMVHRSANKIVQGGSGEVSRLIRANFQHAGNFVS
jgi:hypothetical protein